MKKKVYIVGAEGPGSGMWDWFHTKEAAEKQYNLLMKDFQYIKDEIIYQGEYDVDEGLSDDTITQLVEHYLEENDFENAFK